MRALESIGRLMDPDVLLDSLALAQASCRGAFGGTGGGG